LDSHKKGLDGFLYDFITKWFRASKVFFIEGRKSYLVELKEKLPLKARQETSGRAGG